MGEVVVRLPPWAKPFTEHYRYKVLYGGRGGAKSWFFARLLILLTVSSKKRVLCARELQVSIRDSVHHLLAAQIHLLDLEDEFEITNTHIRCPTTGSEFVFKGVRHNTDEIKSFEDVDICWVEEARNVSKESLDVLIPTIRKAGSEIWFSFNTRFATDPVYKMFVVNTPPRTLVKKVLWSDNPWLSEELEEARLYMMANDPDAYDNVWQGNTVTYSAAQVFNGKWISEPFEPGDNWDGPYFGADWGFSTDPTALIKSWVHDDTLYVEREAYGYGVENDDLPALFDTIPGSKQHKIWADNSRPETIRHVKGKGYKIEGAPKWPGSIEDGVARIRMFRRIVIHTRCSNLVDEASNYKHKVDRLTQEILPDIVDKSNHGWDAIRYSIHRIIRNSLRRSYAGSR